MSAPLYNRDILRLATTLGDYPRLAVADATVERRSVVCGSRVVIDLRFDEAGRVAAFGMAVHACALGQASAALLAASLIGQGQEEIETAQAALNVLLDGEGAEAPFWPGLSVLAAARGYPARHASIRLPFAAAAEAAARARTKAGMSESVLRGEPGGAHEA